MANNIAELLTACWQILGIIVALIGIAIGIMIIIIIVIGLFSAFAERRERKNGRKKN